MHGSTTLIFDICNSTLLVVLKISTRSILSPALNIHHPDTCSVVVKIARQGNTSRQGTSPKSLNLLAIDMFNISLERTN